MKALFVIQRYGLDVDGGAELYCRWLAEKCSQDNDITVLTTTARDYISWQNYYEPGEDKINGIPIIRMPVDRTRDIDSFNQFTNKILSAEYPISMQNDWIRMQGPWSRSLLNYLKHNHERYDLIYFFTYLYGTSLFGTRIAPGKSILVPTAHDEPVAHLQVVKEMYSRIAGLMYLTQAEKEFVESTYDVGNKPSVLLGTGVKLPASSLTDSDVKAKYNLEGQILLYIGRVEAGKGCRDLVSFFKEYKRESQKKVTLVLAGRQHLPDESEEDIVYTGFIPDEEIKPLLEAADIIIVPSPFESLSILLLQAFICRKPVLVNGHSPVLRSHCISSNGGLFYYNSEEFSSALDLLLKREDLRSSMGFNGLNYIEQNFTWTGVLQKFHNFSANFDI